jgi:hypothetical protein
MTRILHRLADRTKAQPFTSVMFPLATVAVLWWALQSSKPWWSTLCVALMAFLVRLAQLIDFRREHRRIPPESSESASP